MTEFYYRYYDVGWDEYSFQIHLERFRVVKKTPRGAWIEETHGYPVKKRFVLDGARRRYAYPTKALALNSYRIRKRWQIGYCKNKIDRANAILGITEKAPLDEVAGIHQIYQTEDE